MTYSYTKSDSVSFTRSQARKPASKVATDLKRMQRYYKAPSDRLIAEFEEELIEYLINDYFESVEYGFKKTNGSRVVSLYYQVDLSGSLIDGHAGGVPVGVDISDASWFSFLIPNQRWRSASESEKKEFRDNLPLQRSSGPSPRDGLGYWAEDRSYSHTGSGVRRKIYRPF